MNRKQQQLRMPSLSLGTSGTSGTFVLYLPMNLFTIMRVLPATIHCSSVNLLSFNIWNGGFASSRENPLSVHLLVSWSSVSKPALICCNKGSFCGRTSFALVIRCNRFCYNRQTECQRLQRVLAGKLVPFFYPSDHLQPPAHPKHCNRHTAICLSLMYPKNRGWFTAEASLGSSQRHFL